MQIQPIRDFILLQPEPLPETTAGGLFLPKNTKERTLRGKVLATGPGRVTDHGVRVPVEVKAGDRVVYLEHNMAQRVGRLEGEDGPVLLPEMDVIAVVEA
jgi:chaperonin GroES